MRSRSLRRSRQRCPRATSRAATTLTGIKDTGGWHLLFEDLSKSSFCSDALAVTADAEHNVKVSSAHGRGSPHSWWDDARLGTTVGTWQDAGATEQSFKRLVEQYGSFADDLGDRLSTERREHYARLFDAAPRLIGALSFASPHDYRSGRCSRLELLPADWRQCRCSGFSTGMLGGSTSAPMTLPT